MTNVADDNALGKISRQQHDFFRRVREGSVDVEQALAVQQVIQCFVDGKLPNLTGLVQDTHEIVRIKHVVDLDDKPLVPFYGWTVEEHRTGGLFEWSPDKVRLYSSSNQCGEGAVEGNKLREELSEVPVLNANLLDYLLEHPLLIPNAWQKQRLEVYFWGTIYGNVLGSESTLYVRCLYLNRPDVWRGGFSPLGELWKKSDPALCLAA